MNNSIKNLGLFIFMAIIAVSCNNTTTEAYHENASATAAPVTAETHKATVEEVLYTSAYTYLLMNENGEQSWIAIPKKEVNPGETYYYKGGLEMPDFKSKELDRTFDKVYFVESISESPNQPQQHAAKKQEQPAGKIDPARGVVAQITHEDGEVSLATLFADRQSFADKEVKVRGTVVKVNEQIMGKNWVHIQDGSEYNGEFDLTVTTSEMVKLGDVVGFEGTIALEKDFGYGYKYDIILEDAKIESTVRL